MSDIKAWDLVELYRNRELSYRRFIKDIENLYEDIEEYSKKEIKQNLNEDLIRLENELYELD